MSGAEFVYWVHALSSLHPGTGRGEGYIDLPLAREKVTGFPFLPGSTMKGVFADSCGATDVKRRPPTSDREPNPEYDATLHAAFGRAGNDTANAGALVFTDARLICLPARSLYGTFAWCTSSYILRRLNRDLEMAGQPTIPEPACESSLACVPDGRPSPTILADGAKIFLEDWDLVYTACARTKQWAQAIAGWVFPRDANQWQTEFVKRFLVLSDELFNFLAQTGTEVQAHIKIEQEQKRAAGGALWYEETLPPETILAGLVWCDPIRGVAGVNPEDVKDLCRSREGESAIQIGGKATVGKGRCRLLFVPRPQGAPPLTTTSPPPPSQGPPTTAVPGASVPGQGSEP